jgi:hypothetical protein
MATSPLALLFVASTWSAYAAGPADEAYRKLSGIEIRKCFIGKTFTDDTHFSNRYNADGTIEGFAMGRKVTNTWKINKDELCVTNSFGELCYTVWKKGSDGSSSIRIQTSRSMVR